MKHLKTYKSKYKPKELKYKEGDYAIYDKYVGHPGILVKILTARKTSDYPYFAENVKPPFRTHTLQEDELIDLNQEQRDELNLYLDTLKFNL